MTALAWLIPAALLLSGLGLLAFLWALKSGQFEDLEGAAWRALQDDREGSDERPSGDNDQGSGVPPEGSLTRPR